MSFSVSFYIGNTKGVFAGVLSSALSVLMAVAIGCSTADNQDDL